MKIFKFFVSKAFWGSIIIALVLVLVACFVLLQWLKVTTNHDQRISVPDLINLNTEKALLVLQENDLQMVVVDTLDFDKNIEPLAILEQDPKGNSDVKQNRKIYVKVNAAGYGNVMLPDLEHLTHRQALATINSLGLKPGVVTYKSFIGKDVVLGITQKGTVLKPGDKVVKNSTIDFILGDGRAPLTAQELDRAPEID